MGLAELLRWQWDGYPRYLRSRENLLIRLVAVPVFLLTSIGLFGQPAQRSAIGVGLFLAVMLDPEFRYFPNSEGRGKQARGDAWS